ncbi:oligosaccharide flippase family protein [Candidatus Riflebacteria bacterium]
MIARHSVIYLLARGLPGIINFLAIAVYSRILSPDAYGQYALAIAAVGLGNAIIFWWLRLGLIRFFASYVEEREIFFSTLFNLYLILVLSSSLLLLLTYFICRSWIETEFLLLIAGLLWIQAWFEMNLELPRSELKPLLFGAMSMFRSIVSILLGVLFVFSGFGAAGVLMGLSIGAFLPSLWVFKRYWLTSKPGYFDANISRKLWAYGLPLSAAFALNSVISSSDRILLGFLINTDAAGLYSAGYDLTGHTIGILMVIIYLAAYPVVIQSMENQGRSAAKERLEENFSLLLFIALPAAAGFAFLAPNIANVFLGTAFRKLAIELIPLVALAIFISGFKAYHFDIAFQLSCKTHLQILVLFIAAIINIALNLWWIPLYGPIGAAYATIVSFFAGLCMSALWGRKYFEVPVPSKVVVKILVSTVIMVMVIGPLRSWSGGKALFIQVTSGVFVYGIMALNLDIIQIRSRLKKTWTSRNT